MISLGTMDAPNRRLCQTRVVFVPVWDRLTEIATYSFGENYEAILRSSPAIQSGNCPRTVPFKGVSSDELILDPRLADQWFAEEDEQIEARAMVTTLRANIGPRIAALQRTIDPLTTEKVIRELHSLRGAIASIGFSACARHMLDLEKNWLTLSAADRNRGIDETLDAFQAGLDHLTARYPYLSS